MADFKTDAQEARNAITSFKKKASDAQIYINTQSGSVIERAVGHFVQNTLDMLIQFVDYLIEEMKTKVGLCRPIFDAIDGFAALLCDGFLGTLNSFWFALGLGLMTFIPAMCCNCRLAKYYCRMKATDLDSRRSTFTERKKPLVSTANRKVRKVGPLSLTIKEEDESQPNARFPQF